MISMKLFNLARHFFERSSWYFLKSITHFSRYWWHFVKIKATFQDWLNFLNFFALPNFFMIKITFIKILLSLSLALFYFFDRDFYFDSLSPTPRKSGKDQHSHFIKKSRSLFIKKDQPPLFIKIVVTTPPLKLYNKIYIYKKGYRVCKK